MNQAEWLNPNEIKYEQLRSCIKTHAVNYVYLDLNNISFLQCIAIIVLFLQQILHTLNMGTKNEEKKI